VDGVKFDVYRVGAVLYSMVEDSFPAHGALSTVTRRCPDALRWVIRRAMAETNQRYATASEMLRDLQAVIASDDPFAMKPKDLPSMGGEPVEELAPTQADEDAEVIAAAFAPASVGGQRERAVDVDRMVGGAADGLEKQGGGFMRWLKGGVVGASSSSASSSSSSLGASAGVAEGASAPRAVRPASFRTAAEQRERARTRAKAARNRVRSRMDARRAGHDRKKRYSNNPTAGVFLGLFLFASMFVGLGVITFALTNVSSNPRSIAQAGAGVLAHAELRTRAASG